MSGFTKLFSSITTSSLWCQDHVVLRVWIAMLAGCDSNGVVEGSIPGLAHLCMITPDEMVRVLGILSAPDEFSRTKDHEGRRIQVVDGGWQILNYKSYRERCQAKGGSRAPYMRERRAEKCNTLQPPVTRNTEAEAEYRVQKKEKDSSPAAPVPPPQKPKKEKKVKTSFLKPESQKAWDAVASEFPRTTRKWSDETREWVDEPNDPGSIKQGQECFQALVDSGAGTPYELYAAWHAYVTEEPKVAKGFVQRYSTFYGPGKATWLQWLERGRQLIKEAS